MIQRLSPIRLAAILVLIALLVGVITAFVLSHYWKLPTL